MDFFLVLFKSVLFFLSSLSTVLNPPFPAFPNSLLVTFPFHSSSSSSSSCSYSSSPSFAFFVLSFPRFSIFPYRFLFLSFHLHSSLSLSFPTFSLPFLPYFLFLNIPFPSSSLLSYLSQPSFPSFYFSPSSLFLTVQHVFAIFSYPFSPFLPSFVLNSPYTSLHSSSFCPY